MSIADQLEGFQRSEETSYTFPPGLSNHDRAIVHTECRKYGFTSKSAGRGDSRQVSVYKPRGQGRAARDVFDLPVSPASLQVLQSYYERFPPTEAEIAAFQKGEDVISLGKASHAQHSSSRGKRKGPPGAAHFTAAQIQDRLASHAEAQSRPEVQTIAAARAALPIAPYREQIVEAVRNHQVILLAGETGCGKTTQVPQYILEDSWALGKGCRILCTQPRRISAVSVAERVAAERGEKIGGTVGYTIRLESKGGPQSSLMFCTNGVLLRMLTHGDGLSDITHVVVDEIHERDSFADFLLIILRDVLPQHPQLRVVLMSATLHIDLFSSYFGGCPVIQVPGFTHPVTDMYLEDILKLIGYQDALLGIPAKPARLNGHSKPQHAGKAPIVAVPPEQRQAIEDAIMAAFLAGTDDNFDKLLEVTGAILIEDIEASRACVNVQHQGTGATALMAAAGKGRLEDAAALLTAGADPVLKSNDGSTAQDWADRFGHEELAEFLGSHMQASQTVDAEAESAIAISQYHANTDADEVDLALVEALLMYVCGEGVYKREGEDPNAAQGAVLVFLPGWDEIIRLKDQLEAPSSGFSRSRYSVLPLHSMVPAADQRKVFVRPPIGVRKIVLATNIAETAVTIDDIVCVINSGRHKEKSYDPYTNVSTLQAQWISKASERQRRGRAGRCQQGVCFHLYSKARSSGLAEYQLPELQRSPLDELSLQARLLGIDIVKMLEGGSFTHSSVAEFLNKAVEPPPEISVSNAVRLLQDIGAFEAGTEQLTVLGRHLAALPLPPRIGKMLLYGVLFGCLDPVLTVTCAMAYRDPWVLPIEAGARRAATLAKRDLAQGAGGCSDHLALVRAYNGWQAAKRTGGHFKYTSSMFLSNGTMTMIEGMRGQLLGELTARGFVESLATGSCNSADAGLVRSVLAAGFYPLIGRLDTGKEKEKGKPRKASNIVTAKEERVKIHISSVNCGLDMPPSSGLLRPCPIVIFDEVTRNESQLTVRQSTAVNPHVVPLVAASIQLLPSTQQQKQDDWSLTEEDLPRSGRRRQHLKWTEEEDDYNESDDDGDDLDDDEADDHDNGSSRTRIQVDGWLTLETETSAVAPLLCLRHRLSACFAAKVSNPKGVLDESQAGALQTAADLFSLEAGGPQSGASLAPGPIPGSARPSGPPAYGSAGRYPGRGRSHAVPMPGRTGRHPGRDQRGGTSFGGGRGLPHYARDNGVAPMSVSPAGAGPAGGGGRAPRRGREPDQAQFGRGHSKSRGRRRDP
ncbi:g12825 [Coccomyxa viridis]|uniref:G12825 protein n=1 Tax=Coccomyxa viridis TaxID=1274662 RepID=A0ABP1GBB7_9CHLO